MRRCDAPSAPSPPPRSSVAAPPLLPSSWCSPTSCCASSRPTPHPRNPPRRHRRARSLAGGNVDAGQAPHVGFAFEESARSGRELYGAFQASMTSRVWQGVRGFHDVAALADGISFAIDGPDGGGTASIRRVGDGTVAFEITAPALSRASAAFRCGPTSASSASAPCRWTSSIAAPPCRIWVERARRRPRPSDEYPGDWFLRGTRHQTYFPMPFFVSSHDYGVRADTSYRSVFAMCSESDDAWRVEAWEGTMSLHIFYGASPLEVIRRHSDVEGRAPVPPPFAFAPWNDAIFGSASVRARRRELRAESHPVVGDLDRGLGRRHRRLRRRLSPAVHWTRRSHALPRRRKGGRRSARAAASSGSPTSTPSS